MLLLAGAAGTVRGEVGEVKAKVGVVLKFSLANNYNNPSFAGQTFEFPPLERLARETITTPPIINF